jgi:hypothetical protein
MAIETKNHGRVKNPPIACYTDVILEKKEHGNSDEKVWKSKKPTNGLRRRCHTCEELTSL